MLQTLFSADVVYAAMRKLALQRQQDSAEAPEGPTPALDAEVVDGEEAEGATGEQEGWRMIHKSEPPCRLPKFTMLTPPV